MISVFFSEIGVVFAMKAVAPCCSKVHNMSVQ
jgi:hypothetical protein